MRKNLTTARVWEYAKQHADGFLACEACRDLDITVDAFRVAVHRIRNRKGGDGSEALYSNYFDGTTCVYGLSHELVSDISFRGKKVAGVRDFTHVGLKRVNSELSTMSNTLDIPAAFDPNQISRELSAARAEVLVAVRDAIAELIEEAE